MNDTQSVDPQARREFRPGLQRAIGRKELQIGLIAALLAGLAGCHSSSPRATSSDRTAPLPLQTPALADASYDWHGLLVAPFGSALKAVPLTLHEVLLFRDEAHGADAADEAECYAGDAAPPRFAGRTPDEYLLCFKQDRLSRVRASVRLSTVEAPELFAAACARWSKQATPASQISPTTVQTPSPASETSAPNAMPTAARDAAQASDICEGHDGGIHFRGRLETEPAHGEGPEGERVLSITLDGPPAP